MASVYKHLFFDLDHTLWDFEANSRDTLYDLFLHQRLENILKTDYETFYRTYIEINNELWSLYRIGKVTKEQLRATRFYKTFCSFHLDDREFSSHFEKQYLKICPHKTQLLPGTEELLHYLHKRYELHVLTNGFAETQMIKMAKSGLNDFFGTMVSSEVVGVNKPDPRIFKESLAQTGAKAESALMVGDNLDADIIGAQQCGIDQVYYNPLCRAHRAKPTFEVSHLLQMKAFL